MDPCKSGVTPTQAELAATEQREKAELLDWLMSGKYADISTRVDEWMDLFGKSDLSVEESLEVLRAARTQEAPCQS